MPYIENNHDQVRQIHHIVLLPTNIFIVETKYWKGKVVHGLSKKMPENSLFFLMSCFIGCES
ncbi:nuclease-related domain-containing protein [Sporosarcina sp. YIM B06819]|uniref:nuclease-related domain-containing protein n=1 Tax=Sporosarcina sp. YIM B06819 TaxID=3081769 RepID=UPI0039921AB3